MPAYYLAIALTYLVSGEPKENFYSYVFFFTNFSQYYAEAWGTMPHLWSLAVEQQFYLIWPWLILYLPRPYLLLCILSFIVVGVGSQHLLLVTDFNAQLPFTCFDSLDLGSLLAWLYDTKKYNLRSIYYFMMMISCLSIIIMAMFFVFRSSIKYII